MKGVPAMTVWIGFAPDADGDGARLGEPDEGGEPDAEDGNTFEVGITGVDSREVPASLGGITLEVGITGVDPRDVPAALDC